MYMYIYIYIVYAGSSMTHVQVLKFPSIIPAPFFTLPSLSTSPSVPKAARSWNKNEGGPTQRSHNSAYLSWTILDGIYYIYTPSGKLT